MTDHAPRIMNVITKTRVKFWLSLGMILAMCWATLWGVAALHYIKVMDHWVAEGKAEGYNIGYDQRDLFGFPTRIVLRFRNLTWVDTDGISFRADTIDISALPWHWHHYKASFKGNATIKAPLYNGEESLMLSSMAGTASVMLTPEGRWLSSSLDLHQTAFGRAPAMIATADMLSLTLQRPEVMPSSSNSSGLEMHAEATQLKIPTVFPGLFGDTITNFTLKAHVMGFVPDFRNPFSVKKWNDLGGLVQFDQLKLAWGVLDMDIQGAIAFDDDLQPEGAFAGRLTHPKPVFQTLMDRGFIAPRQSSMLDTALRLFSKPSSDRHKHPDAVDLPISVQLGSLYFGPVRILSFPPIAWPIMPEGGTFE